MSRVSEMTMTTSRGDIVFEMFDDDAPKTVCLPSSHGAASVVTMKNCEPFVFGPALAIASAPRTTLCWLISSSNS